MDGDLLVQHTVSFAATVVMFQVAGYPWNCKQQQIAEIESQVPVVMKWQVPQMRNEPNLCWWIFIDPTFEMMIKLVTVMMLSF